mmetsp:Transcript_16249/g.41328  ORF Transcript_16249/g.41328 Transcript_16249/m.41328 type:complete len:363 (-) Transcript_16249:138-1226(-)
MAMPAAAMTQLRAASRCGVQAPGHRLVARAPAHGARALRSSLRVGLPSEPLRRIAARGAELDDLAASEEKAKPAEVETVASPGACCEEKAAAAAAAAATAAEEEDIVIVEVEQSPLMERLQSVDYVKAGMYTGAGLLGLTLTIALFRTGRKYMAPKAKRKRTVNKNKLLVDKLNEFLPAKRAELTPQATKMLMFQTGFTGTEVFRKFLWYLLRERKFDQDAITDLSQLKSVLGLSDEQVADALSERSKRVYEKYGTLIMNTAGMTAEGATRKATGRALFSKLLYISESEEVLAQGSEAAQKLSVMELFGATERDASDLRIVSLYDVDMDKLDQMAQASSMELTADEDISPGQPKGDGKGGSA